jgi:[ribosomal protein S18]-alanine N-acetyltransferase
LPGLRPATLKDFPRIHEINVAAFPQPWSLESLRLAQKTGVYVVSQDEAGAVVGFLLATVEDGAFGVVLLAVDHHARRHGHAHALITWAIGEARRRGLPALTVQLRVKNEAAVTLFRSFGFDFEPIPSAEEEQRVWASLGVKAKDIPTRARRGHVDERRQMRLKI